MDAEPERRLTLAEIQRLHYLYERCSAGLARLDTFSTDPALRAYLESLVSRAYMRDPRDSRPGKIRWKALVDRPFRAPSGATWRHSPCRWASPCWAAHWGGSPSAWIRAPRPC